MSTSIAVLASGRGSNLQAVLDAIAAGRLDAQVVGVFSDKPDAAALQRVPQPLRWAARPRDFSSRDAYELALGDAIARHNPDWILCAGYMRILGADIVNRCVCCHSFSLLSLSRVCPGELNKIMRSRSAG